MKSKKIHKKIQSVLTTDETIEATFKLKGCEICATDKRLLELAGRTIRDYDYTHISSIAHTSKRYWRLIILGIILMIAGYFAGSLLSLLVESEEGAAISISSLVVGLILIIIGAIKKSEWVEINVVGVSNPIKYKGSRDALDSLLQIVRQKRLAEHTPDEKEIKDVAFVETIRKLAELKDQGIITQEEFEEKKSNLLRNSD